MKDQDRIKKLPLWAQDKIAELETRVQDLTETNLRLRNLSAPEESRVVVDPYHHKMNLENRDTVRFYPGEEIDKHKYIDVSFDPGYETVCVRGNFGIYLLPQAGNTIRVGASDV